jgi:uncharacterized membrane protein
MDRQPVSSPITDWQQPGRSSEGCNGDYDHIVVRSRRRTLVAQLIVVGFRNDIYRASQVLDELRVLDDEWLLELRDSVAFHRDSGGALNMDQSYQPTGQHGAGWGATLGLLIGATLAIPFAAGASAAIAAGAMAAGILSGATGAALGASFWKNEFGIPEDFVREVSVLVDPGSSAIYAILEWVEPVVVADRFRKYGGTMLQTTLNANQQTKIEKAIRTARL